MRGRTTGQPNLFVKLNLEAMVPPDHPLRAIKRMADESLAAMSRTFAAAYSKIGRPSVLPRAVAQGVAVDESVHRPLRAGPV